MEYLIQEYLAEQLNRSNNGTAEDALFPKQEELYSALIQFSQMILFAANHESMFSAQPGLIIGAISQGMTGLFRSTDAEKESNIKASLDSYVAVLQTIGNSILVHVNELREDRQFEEDSVKAGAREATALIRVLDISPPQVLREWKFSLQSRLDEAEKRHSQLPGAKPEDVGDVIKASTRLADAEKDEKSKRELHGKAVEALTAATAAEKILQGRIVAFNQVREFLQSLERWAGIVVQVGKAAGTSEVDDVFDSKAAELSDERKNKEKDARTAVEALAAAGEELAVAKTAREVCVVRQAGEMLDALTGKLLKVDSKKPVLDRQQSPETVVDRALEAVQGQIDNSKDNEEKEKLKFGLAVLREYVPGNKPISIGNARTSLEVIDTVIATLREEHIQAVRRGESASPDAAQIQLALDAAYDHRASMMHIRPASAYLRNSFPATTLQRDARIGWTNMLAEHMQRQLPFYDVSTNGPDIKTLVEVDKQFWQNINTVRVAAGGDTNYVIAKDDIGNWYVKNYSADPKDVINSARNLALFTLSGQTGINSFQQTPPKPGCCCQESGRSRQGRWSHACHGHCRRRPNQSCRRCQTARRQLHIGCATDSDCA